MAVQEQFMQDFFGFEMDSCFDFQQSQQQNLYFLQQQQQQLTASFEHCNRGTEASSSSSSSTSFDNFLPQFLDVQLLEMQRQELDSFLQTQTERLKSGIEEQKNKQMAVLLKRVESEAMHLMKQKEQDLTQARNKSIQLESCITRTQKESDSWQLLAKENEAIAINLSKQIELLSTQENCQDSESICCGSCPRNDVVEEERPRKIVCKGCNCRASSLILLPCRHLCSCKFCEPFFISCPVCESFKEGCIEVFWV